MNIVQRINRRLLPCKIHYFLFSGGQAAVLPFIPVLAKHLGISPEVVGVLYTILPLVPMFSNPLTGIAADKLGKLKIVMMVALAFFTLFICSVAFLPLQSNTADVDLGGLFWTNSSLTCTPNGSFVNMCNNDSLQTVFPVYVVCNFTCSEPMELPKIMCLERDVEVACKERTTNGFFDREALERSTEEHKSDSASVPTLPTQAIPFWWNPLECSENSFWMLPHSPDVNWISSPNCTSNLGLSCHADCLNLNKTEKTSSDRSVYGHFSFWWLCFSTVVAWVCLGTVTCLTDAIILDNLGEDVDQFGHQRLWGTIGAGISVILTGYLNEKASKRAGHVDYRIGFCIFFILLNADQYAIYRMEDSKQPKPQNIRKCIAQLFRSFQIIVLLSAFFVIGVLVGILESFHLWYLEDLGANQVLLGLARGMQLFGGELPSFIVAGWIINKIGYVNAVTIVLAVYGVRYLGYSLLVDPWITLPLELTHAAYGIFYCAMAAYASIVAPPGMSATMQAIVGAMYEGAGIGVGSLLGGFLYGSVGGQIMFFWLGIVALIYSVFHGVLQLIISRFQLGETDIHGRAYKENNQDQPALIPENKDPIPPKENEIEVRLNGNAMYIVTSV